MDLRPAVTTADHPRIRGEHPTSAASSPRTWGSSPHTRGARFARELLSLAVRIIPAYAGSTRVPRRSPRNARDHPRIRGEHFSPGGLSPLLYGSSPHTRGAPARRRRRHLRDRIIPAYAGSTPTPSGTSRRETDHPRIRGEHSHRPLMMFLPTGSSPHTRGALAEVDPGQVGARIIPAYAGSTSRRCPERLSRADHPRIRGEHDFELVLHVEFAGSSPHTRGALRQGFRGLERAGIIPAYAGSTTASASALRALSDHPRIRGEHDPRRRGPPAAGGSSPHTRGARGL